MSNKVPQIRFTGYSDPWVQRKAKDLFIPMNERNREDLPVLSVTQDQGVVFRNDLAIDIKYDESTLSSYKVIHPGDFIISLRSFQGGFELSNVLGISSPAYTIFDFAVPAQQDKLYWKTIFKTFKFIESLKTVTFGIRDGKSISFKEFGDLKLNYPSDVNEQRRIGEFFAKLDETIAANQRKLDLLKEQKKRYLQKMFPKNGAKVPELRFAGFDDDWEQRKLGDLLKEFSIKSKIEDEHKVLSSTNSGMEFREGRVSGTSNLGYKIIKNGDLVLSPQNLWLGNININNIGKGLVSPSYKTFELINIDSSFINPQLRTQKMLEEYKNSSTQGASVVRRNLEIDSFYQIKIFVPTISEQEKIGSFFQQLDNTIVLHQRKLDLLKEQKTGFLQKMFV